MFEQLVEMLICNNAVHTNTLPYTGVNKQSIIDIHNLGHVYAQEEKHRHTAHKKHIYVKHTKQSSPPKNEESSVEAAPSAKEVTHLTTTRWLP